MATIGIVQRDQLCDDESCDEILRQDGEARIYKGKAYCLKSHERAPGAELDPAPDTWLSERLDRLCESLELVAESLGVIADTRIQNYMSTAERACHGQLCQLDHFKGVGQ